MTGMVKMLEEHPHVERYAWMSARATELQMEHNMSDRVALIDGSSSTGDLNLTDLGTWFVNLEPHRTFAPPPANKFSAKRVLDVTMEAFSEEYLDSNGEFKPTTKRCKGSVDKSWTGVTMRVCQ